MGMSCGVVLSALVGIDAVVALVLGKDELTLRSSSGTGVVVNVMTLVVCLVFGAALHGMHRLRRDEELYTLSPVDD